MASYRLEWDAEQGGWSDPEIRAGGNRRWTCSSHAFYLGYLLNRLYVTRFSQTFCHRIGAFSSQKPFGPVKQHQVKLPSKRRNVVRMTRSRKG